MKALVESRRRERSGHAPRQASAVNTLVSASVALNAWKPETQYGRLLAYHFPAATGER